MKNRFCVLTMFITVGILNMMSVGQDNFNNVLTPHPVQTASDSVNSPSGFWRHRSGDWGEDFVQETLKLRGYDVYKTPGLQGIDRIAVRRAPDGTLLDVKLIEVKTHRGTTPKLSETKGSGKQMSRKWLADRLKEMSKSSDPEVRKLAREVSQFRKTMGVPIERLGELHDVNTRTGKYKIRNPITHAVQSEMKLDRLLKNIKSRAKAKDARKWAKNTLSSLDQIRNTSMTPWIDRASNRFTKIIRKGSTKGISKSLGKAIARAAGPIALVVGIAIDAKELHGYFRAYTSGEINRREFHVGVAGLAGGMAGAGLGAWGGAKAGVALGALGGPFAWITVPVGGIVGGVVGGAIGYFGGSALSRYTVDQLYENLDESIKIELNSWIKMTSLSNANKLLKSYSP